MAGITPSSGSRYDDTRVILDDVLSPPYDVLGEDDVHRPSTGAYALGASINATQVSAVRAVAERGETMPLKSTYFHPRLLTGLVLDALEGD